MIVSYFVWDLSWKRAATRKMIYLYLEIFLCGATFVALFICLLPLIPPSSSNSFYWAFCSGCRHSWISFPFRGLHNRRDCIWQPQEVRVIRYVVTFRCFITQTSSWRRRILSWSDAVVLKMLVRAVILLCHIACDYLQVVSCTKCVSKYNHRVKYAEDCPSILQALNSTGSSI